MNDWTGTRKESSGRPDLTSVHALDHILWLELCDHWFECFVTMETDTSKGRWSIQFPVLMAVNVHLEVIALS